MNPFDLQGPQFLLLYFCLAAMAVVAVIVRRRERESGGTIPPGALQDPYRIAYLRGGKKELLNTLVVSLLNRGLLQQSGDHLKAPSNWRNLGIKEPGERALLEFCEASKDMREIHAMSILSVSDQYEAELERLGLLPGPAERDLRRSDSAIALLVVISVAVVKYGLAVSRGRQNRGLLVVFGILAVIAIIAVSFPRLTARGRHAIDSLQELMSDLKNRANSLHFGQSGQEMALLAAVFGVGMVPLPDKEKLWKASASSGGCGSSCGSSCSSSSSCGGGGGCGGGGCGGCGS
ncbi:MAG: TIGR04222 domain-containing membrane protein [Acidobacteria bacterium]|nr:TIGR04222 domain-containing membrane protein [Acidobacteriota bacterium]